MRQLLHLLLALGLWQLADTQIHCAFEPPDCQEGACDFCHMAEIPPLEPGSARLALPAPNPNSAVAPSLGAIVRPLLRNNRGRAPPL